MRCISDVGKDAGRYYQNKQKQYYEQLISHIGTSRLIHLLSSNFLRSHEVINTAPPGH